MKKTKKINLPKNKILILLSVILVVFIGLLSACILIQSRYSEPTIADIEPSVQNARTAKKDADAEQKKEKKSKKNQTRILRSENGKMEITNQSNAVSAKTNQPASDAQNSGNPSIDAVTAEVSGLMKAVPLTAIPAPIIQNEQIQTQDTGDSGASQGLSAQNTVQDNLLDAESGSLVAKAQQETQSTSITGKNGLTPAAPAIQSTGTLIFVFDDAGHNMTQLQPFLELPFPITVAVLPGLDYSAQAAQKARNSGKEVILHQPMQAKNRSVDPGPCAIKPDMTADEVYDLVRQNIASLGPVSGINNHEGSLITENENLLGAVMDVCRAEQLYFLDSRTTSASVAKKVAAQRSLPIWERTVFLDNTQNKKDIETAVKLGMELAAKNGSAIMIGHVWTSSLPSILIDLYPEMIMQGFTISTISKSRSKITGN
ncbi:MAG: divergent polysaccharide deacetylase family protein [Spirochaetaceae bacterium]|nr:divergent polysaccharide deacetylase family protein [Spirochaetaceae bacterium]